MALTIQFLGGARTVTGSKVLVEAAGKKILIDCGLFQGLKELRLMNWARLPVPPSSLDAVLLTHAHLDHTGYLPILVRDGFSGPVFATPPTRDLAEILLIDSAHIQEEDAEYANRMGFSKHHPAKPLYNAEDARRALSRIVTVPNGDWTDVLGVVRFRFIRSGHILGSAFIELEAEGTKIVFTGDLGRQAPLLLNPPSRIEHADYLVVESTYGDRQHDPCPPLDALARIVNETVERRGHLIIPSFAVGRTQDVLFLLAKLRAESRIPAVPVFLDSPMGINATEILTDYPDWHGLTRDEVRGLCRVATMVKSQQQSSELLRRRESAIIIAGSGMVSGGRVLHHLASRLPDPRNTVLLVGFQAAGTRGALLRSGIRELKIHGQYVPVRARVEEISGLSAHADQAEILAWLRGFKTPPRQTFIVHGEAQAADALRVKIADTFGWSSVAPSPLEVFRVGGGNHGHDH